MYTYVDICTLWCIVWNNISLHSTSTTSPRHRQTAGEDHFEVCRPIRRGWQHCGWQWHPAWHKAMSAMPKGWNCQREQRSGPKSNEIKWVNVQKIMENLCHYSNVAYSTNECNKKIQKLSPAISKIWCTLLSGWWIQISPASWTMLQVNGKGAWQPEPKFTATATFPGRNPI